MSPTVLVAIISTHCELSIIREQHWGPLVPHSVQMLTCRTMTPVPVGMVRSPLQVVKHADPAEVSGFEWSGVTLCCLSPPLPRVHDSVPQGTVCNEAVISMGCVQRTSTSMPFVWLFQSLLQPVCMSLEKVKLSSPVEVTVCFRCTVLYSNIPSLAFL